MTNQISIPADAAPSAVTEDESAQVSAAADSLMNRMSTEMRDTFTPAQRQAVGRAVIEAKTRDFLVNLRLTLFGAFFNIIIGRENRNPVRQAQERQRHPLATPGNLFVLALIAIFGVTLGWISYQLVVHGGL
jgi:hypothetical protein